MAIAARGRARRWSSDAGRPEQSVEMGGRPERSGHVRKIGAGGGTDGGELKPPVGRLDMTSRAAMGVTRGVRMLRALSWNAIGVRAVA